MTFIIGIFQLSKMNTNKKRKIKLNGAMCISDSIFPDLQSSTLFK